MSEGAGTTSPGGILSEILTAYHKLTLAVVHVQNAVLTPAEGATLIAGAATVGADVSAFLAAQGKLTLPVAALIAAGEAGFAASVKDLEGQVLTPAEGQGLISQALRVGADVFAIADPKSPVAKVLFGYRTLTLNLEHVENAVLTPGQGAALIATVMNTGTAVSNFLAAHNLLTPQAAALIASGEAGFSAAVTHLEGQVLTITEAEGIVSQALRVGAGIADFIEQPHPLVAGGSAALFNQFVAATHGAGEVGHLDLAPPPAASAPTLAAPHAA